MKDDLNILENGRQPQYVAKWKTTQIGDYLTNFWQMEYDLNLLSNGRSPQSFVKLKIILIFRECKATSIFCLMEEEVNVS